MGVEVPVGGQWEVVAHHEYPYITNGYTINFQVNGTQYRRLRFFLGFAAQTLNLRVNGSTRVSGAINYQQLNGSGNYEHPLNITNQDFGMAQRGTGYLQGFIIPRRTTSHGWLMVFRGISALSSDYTSVGSAQGTIAGRLFWEWTTPNLVNWDMNMGFSSLAGEAGAYQLFVEGERR